MSTTKELLRAAKELHADFDASMLDDWVHDLKGAEATAINNDGLESQVNYLADSGVTVEEFRAAFSEKASDVH